MRPLVTVLLMLSCVSPPAEPDAGSDDSGVSAPCVGPYEVEPNDQASVAVDLNEVLAKHIDFAGCLDEENDVDWLFVDQGDAGVGLVVVTQSTAPFTVEQRLPDGGALAVDTSHPDTVGRYVVVPSRGPDTYLAVGPVPLDDHYSLHVGFVPVPGETPATSPDTAPVVERSMTRSVAFVAGPQPFEAYFKVHVRADGTGIIDVPGLPKLANGDYMRLTITWLQPRDGQLWERGSTTNSSIYGAASLYLTNGVQAGDELYIKLSTNDPLPTLPAAGRYKEVPNFSAPLEVKFRLP